MFPLGSIAGIRMGATLRGRDATRPDPDGSYRFVRIGDISQEGTLRTGAFVRITPNEPVNEDLWLQEGDVLFPNRGTRTTALAFPHAEPRTIVGPQFFVLRPDGTRLAPEYLAWYLRSPEAAAHFAARRKGTYVQIVQRKDLAELLVPLPPYDIQKQLVRLSELALNERELSQRLVDLKWRVANEQLVQVARDRG
jgi:restriction endonuclease S subunit